MCAVSMKQNGDWEISSQNARKHRSRQRLHFQIANDTLSTKKRDSINSDFDAVKVDFKRMKINDSEDADAGNDAFDRDALSEIEAVTLTCRRGECCNPFT